MSGLLERRPEGLYCAAGDFFVDPWRPVDRAVVTHAHADHARWGPIVRAIGFTAD